MLKDKSQTLNTQETQDKEHNYTFDASETFAPVPDDQPHQQRALCMVKGKLIAVDAKKNQGILLVDQDHYPCTFIGRLKPLEMAKRVNKELCFTAWPTGQISTTKKGQLPLVLLQLHNLRKSVSKDKNGFCELRGFIHSSTRQRFQLNIHSEKTQNTYTINVYGKCPAKAGAFVKVEAMLTPKGLKLLEAEVLGSSF